MARITQQEWTRDEILYVMNHYKKDKTSREIADHLGRSKNSIIGKANRLKEKVKDDIIWMDEEVEFVLHTYDHAPESWNKTVNFLGIPEKYLIGKIAEERKVAHENVQDYLRGHREG